ncbi:MAG: hypothetical protein IKX79_03475 [Desulfovibrionaceae bacterium]|nr:hypothetical protein [Desulfovibrionaceae bacterium]
MKSILFSASLCLLLLLNGCAAQVPEKALMMAPTALQTRQLQTRRFATTNKRQMLSAASAVLQDLGFSIEESEVPLGVLVASKKRDATSGAQIAGALVLTFLGGAPVPVDTYQIIRASMVMRPVEGKDSQAGGEILPAGDLAAVRKALENSLAARLTRRYGAEAARKAAAGAAESAAAILPGALEKALGAPLESGESTVRVTFQRIIYNSQNMVTRAEQITDVDVYRGFYEKLSKAVFLEANEL